MAEFSSDAEKKKWESLQHKAGLSLKNISKGNASSSDIQAVSNALAGLNALAKQVFDQAVSAAEVSAKKFQTQYDKALDKRDNDTLSAYEVALNKALATFSPDLVEQIHDVLSLEMLEQSDEMHRVLGTQLTDIIGLLPPKDLPTVDDVLASQELLVEEITNRDNKQWKERKDDLLDSIASVFQATLRDLAEKINQSKQHHGSSTHHPSQAVPRLSHSGQPKIQQHNDWDVLDADDNLHSRGRSLVGFQPQHQLGNSNIVDVTPNTQTQSSTLSTTDNKNSTTSIAMSKDAETAITGAATDQTTLYKQLMDFLANPDGHKSGTEDADDPSKIRKDTEKKGKKDKDKDKGGGWLSALGATLAAMIMDPQLFIGLADSIKKLMTWDNIKQAATASWNYVKDQGKTIIDWIMDKLGLNKKIDQSEATNAKDGGKDLATTKNKPGDTKHADINDPATQAKLKALDADFKDKNANAKLPASKTPTNSSWQSKLTGAVGISNGDPNVVKGDVANQDTNPNSPNYYKKKSSTTKAGSTSTSTTDNSSTSVAGSSSNTTVGGNKASITNNNAGSVSNSTVSAPGTNVTVSPGVTSPPPGSTAPTSAGTGSTDKAKGAPATGMSSFGFHSSVDDSLPLMNSSFLGY